MRIVLLLLLLPLISTGQKFSFEKANMSWSLGTLGGVAQGLARRAENPTAIQFHESVDFGATSINLVVIGSRFEGWKQKTRKQRRQTVFNAVVYTAIGFGSRSLAIKYATQIGAR